MLYEYSEGIVSLSSVSVCTGVYVLKLCDGTIRLLAAFLNVCVFQGALTFVQGYFRKYVHCSVLIHCIGLK